MFDAKFNLVTCVWITVNFGTLKDYSLKINIKHQKVVFVTGTSSTMASTLSQKRLTIFCQKAQNFE